MVQSCPVCKWFGFQMASEYRTKKSGIRMVIMQPKQPYVVQSLPFEYRTIWILDNHSVWHSDESGIRVSGIQMVTVFGNQTFCLSNTVHLLGIRIPTVVLNWSCPCFNVKSPIKNWCVLKGAKQELVGRFQLPLINSPWLPDWKYVWVRLYLLSIKKILEDLMKS